MIFVMMCNDKPEHLQVRLDTRPEHVAYLTGLNEAGKLAFAGPFLDAAGKPCGSLVAVHADDMEGAKALSANDPYTKAGLFASVEIRPWTWTFNKPAES